MTHREIQVKFTIEVADNKVVSKNIKKKKEKDFKMAHLLLGNFKRAWLWFLRKLRYERSLFSLI